jgi:hypothetical protein
VTAPRARPSYRDPSYAARKARRLPTRFAGGFAVVVACAALLSGCAHRIGQNAAQGAVSELKRQNQQNPEQRPAKLMAASAIEGAFEALDQPAQRARIERMVSQAVAAAVQTTVEALDEPAQRAAIERIVSQAVAAAAHTAVEEATREMVVSLGEDGRGPLAVSLSRTGERFAAASSTAAVGGVGSQLAALVPECTGPDALDCIDRRLQRTARLTAASFTSGIKDSLGWQLLLVAFVLGAVGGVLASWLWSLRLYRRRSLRMA